MQPEETTEGTPSGRFPVVGIGASAGGLEAFTLLLEKLPLDTGMAFVLVQHLDPDHSSALPHLLAKATRMPVLQVTDNMRVSPNHVYVIPPNTNLAIIKGYLKLKPRQEHGSSRSIDFFFESLAEDCQERAIGVILSGTASDGTHGAEAIKAEGGIVFAQDESAVYDSMPRSAISAGCVDSVLSPAKIADELAWLAKQQYLFAEGNLPGSVRGPAVSGDGKPEADTTKKDASSRPARDSKRPEGFHEILQLLHSRFGIDLSLYKPNTIERRILRRMVLNKLESLPEYAHLLRKNDAELDALHGDVLIGVTSFFRNPDAFESLKQNIFPRLVHAEREEPLRFWAAGCSSGQEPYSLAIAFAEFGEVIDRPPDLQIFATDISEKQLDRARAGLYPKGLVNEVSPERLQRFFVEESGGYRLVKRLRESVVFAHHNLFSDPPFSRMDLICCRNVMIYLEPELQQRIISLFHYALKPGGILFLGASESIGSNTELFEPIDKKQKIFLKKPAATPPIHMRFASSSFPAVAKTPDSPRSFGGGIAPELNAQREAERITINRFAPPGVLIDDTLRILQFRGETQAFLQPPTGKANFHLLKMARKGLMLPLRAAIEEAKKTNQVVRREQVRFNENGESQTVSIEVIPLKNIAEPHFLIFFEEDRRRIPSPSADETGSAAAEGQGPPAPDPASDDSRRVLELEHELAEARDYIQSIQEQFDVSTDELQTSNEEVQSANEELQSINEELETSKEELESTNEELTTVNEEMANRNTELHRLNNDLFNLQSSVHTAIVLLGRDLSIRRFTPLAQDVFNLTDSDIGRSILRVKLKFDFPNLDQFVRKVIDGMTVREKEVQDSEGRWYSLRARPYRTLDNEIDGAVLMLVDIDKLKRIQEELEHSHKYVHDIVDQVSPLLVLDTDLRVIKANESFLRHFKVSPGETEERLVYDLGNRQWDIPELRNALERILPEEGTLQNFEVEHCFRDIGQRILLLNANQLDHVQNILLSIDDITERRTAERDLKELNQTLEVRVAERTAEVERRIVQLQQISLDLVDTEHRERRRLAVILHDDLQQLLVGAQLHASTAFGPNVSEKGAFVLSLIDQAIASTRSLAKELAPPILYERGLGAALHWLARWAGERYGLKMEVIVDEAAEPSSPNIRIFLFEEVRELLLNVVKHAGTDRVRVSLARIDDSLRLRVEDFGHGFDPAEMANSAKERGFGLFSLQERLSLMNGSIDIDSAPGRGTRIQILVPIESQSTDEANASDPKPKN